jgi:glycosyltransferase involved in cell wall biosynthesis
MPSIGVLSTYPLVEPRHGGQFRAVNIVERFRANGWNAQSVAVVGEGEYPKLGDHDVVFPKDSPHRKFQGRDLVLIDDLQTARFVSDKQTQNAVFSKFKTPLDAITVEQPWLWPLATAYKADVNPRVILCYGSHNIESELKRRIVVSMVGGAYDDVLPKVIDEIAALEKAATREADIVACVSESDRDAHASWGGKRLVVAPNGVSPTRAQPAKIAEWRTKLGFGKFLLYIASAHPPNFTHFSEIVGGSLACFPPDTRLVVVGSVCEHMYRQCKIGKFGAVNLARLNLLFSLDSEDLDAVKHLAHGFFLPIPYGGGTNLKTAEALISGKYIVGTRVGFRGFEAFRDAPGVFACDGPGDLHSAIRQVLSLDPLEAGDASRREELTWERTLQPMVDAVAAAAGARR